MRTRGASRHFRCISNFWHTQIEAVEPRRLLSAFAVNTTSDVTNAGDGLTTLREAIVAANSHAGDDSISFSPTVFTSGSLHTIKLTGGQLTLSDTSGATTITGPGFAIAAVDGDGKSRVFQISSGVSASISGLTITGGLVDDSAVDGAEALGGGIFNAGTLSLTGVTVTANSVIGGGGAAARGGGIYSAAGSLTISGSTIANNQSHGGLGSTVEGNSGSGGAGFGGGIYSAGALSVTDTGITSNAVSGGVNSQHQDKPADAFGGGAYVAGPASFIGSTISGNSATGANQDYLGQGTGNALGGGIYAGGASLTITQTIVSSNQITGGNGGAETSPGGDALGGGVYTKATQTTISDSTISGNQASAGSGGEDQRPTYEGTGAGGGVYSSTGSLTINTSTISGNSAGGGGGGIYASAGGLGAGGGVHSGGALTISRSTIAGNVAGGGVGGPPLRGPDSPGPGGLGAGGGIFALAGANIIDSTVAKNIAVGGTGADSFGDFDGGSGGQGSGAGIELVGGTLTLASSTVSGNAAVGGDGGPVSYNNPGAGVHGPSGTGTGGAMTITGGIAVLTNSILSANAPNDIAGAVNTGSSKFNLIGAGGGLSNGVNGNKVGITDPKLQPLGNYGGPTQTMRPLSGSPVLDAGSNALVPAGVTTDQRGQPRIAGAGVDIGAVELGAPSSSGTGTISGTVFNDGNANGVRDAGEGILKNWKVYLDANHNGKLDTGETSVSSDTSGNWAFHNLVGGSYQVREVGQTGWRATVPSSGFYNLTIKPAGSATGRLFGDTQRAIISGNVFNDANGNKIKDASETNLSGWRVYIDANTDGKFDAGDIGVLSDGSGQWQFGSLSPGTYVVRLVVQSGWSLTTPSTGNFTFAVGNGSSRVGNRFGIRQLG